jgi:hypothetical protein
MREIDQKIGIGKPWKPMAGIAIALLGAFAGGLYVNESRNDDKLTVLQATAQAEVRAVKAQVASHAKTLAEARKQIEALEAALAKERADNSARTLAASQADALAAQRAKKLADSISTLNEELSTAKARLSSLVNTSTQAKSDETKRPQTPPPPAKETPETTLSRRKSDLLDRFSRVSDEFTRPKVYQHDVFTSRMRNCEKKGRSCGKCAFFDLTVDTEGRLIFGGYKFNSLQVLLDDDVSNFQSIEDFQGAFEHRFSKARSLRCRLKWQYFDFNKFGSFTPSASSTFGSEDFELNAEDLMALRETFELAQSFKGVR